MFWKASVLEKTEGNKDFPFIAKLKAFTRKPSVLCYKKSKQKENRTEGNKGTPLFSYEKNLLFAILYWKAEESPKHITLISGGNSPFLSKESAPLPKWNCFDLVEPYLVPWAFLLPR